MGKLNLQSKLRWYGEKLAYPQEQNRFPDNELLTSDFYCPSIIHYTVVCLQPAMDDIFGMEIVHALGNIHLKRKSEIINTSMQLPYSYHKSTNTKM